MLRPDMASPSPVEPSSVTTSTKTQFFQGLPTTVARGSTIFIANPSFPISMLLRQSAGPVTGQGEALGVHLLLSVDTAVVQQSGRTIGDDQMLAPEIDAFAGIKR